jgi:hypothetical protein
VVAGPVPAVGPAEPDAAGSRKDGQYRVAVQRGDNLWDVARTRLGDPRRWPEIYRLNANRYDQHGRMRHGDHIEPGWVLVLPDDALLPAGAASAPPNPPAGQHPASPVTSASPTPPTPGPAGPAPTAPATSTPISTPISTPTPSVTVTPTGPAAESPSEVTPAPAGIQSVAASRGPIATSPARDASPPLRSPRVHPPGISLPGGSWVDLGLAAAIAAVAARVWIQRRRRYTPRPPTADLRLDDPDLAPMPPVVSTLRRWLRRAAQPGDAGLDLLTELPDNPVEVADLDTDLDPDADEREAVEPDHDPDVDLDPFAGPNDPDEDPRASEADGADRAAAGLVPVAPALDHPLLQVWPPAGLGLTGPGAEAAARGFLVAGLAADGLDEPEARRRVVIPAGTLATLLGTAAVQVCDTPRLTVTAGLAEALDMLEAVTLHRTRLAYEHEVDTVAALGDTDPMEEPLPPILLIADATVVHQRARVAALLSQGQRLDIHGVLLGAWADGDTAHVIPDGATSRVDRADGSGGRHGAHPADIGRLAVIDPSQTGDLLRTLAEAHTGTPQPAPPVEAVLSTAAASGASADTGAATHDKAPNDKAANDKAPNDKAPNDKAPNDKAPNDKAPNDKAPNDKAPNDKAPNDKAPNVDTAANGERGAPARPGQADLWGWALVADACAEPGAPPGDEVMRGRPAGSAAAWPDGSATTATLPPAVTIDTEFGTAGVETANGASNGASDEAADESVEAADVLTAAGSGRARVFLLGPPRVDNLPPPSRTDPLLRPKALELFAYLAVHGGEAKRDDILYHVLPDAPQPRRPAG